jgi:hypothetical protein
MKTKILKPVAVVALSILSFTIGAQNIHNAETNKSMELLACANNAVASADVTHSEWENDEAFEYILNEFEKVVKYNPENSVVNTYDSDLLFEEVTCEMEKYLKYKPTDSMVDPQNEITVELSEVMAELYNVVKFKPTDLQ